MPRAPLMLLSLALVLALAAQQTPARLHAGDIFPRFAGQTLTGKSLELPAPSNPSVVVFCFSKAAGDDGRLWNERLSTDFSGAVGSYTIIMLESVPRLFRNMAVSGIRGSMPAPVQDRTVVSYADEALWKERLGVAGGNRAYVVLLGPGGHIRWSNSEAFANAEYSRLKAEIERISIEKRN